MSQLAIFSDIARERERQERLLVERDWRWSMATPGVDHVLKLMPLIEEYGEVLEAFDTPLELGKAIGRVAHALRVEQGFAVAGNSHQNHGLRSELVQVAACAVAWIEALDAEAAQVPHS